MRAGIRPLSPPNPAPFTANPNEPIFLDHWDRYCDLCLADEALFDQQAYVRDIVQRIMLCRDPEGGYARYLCPGCPYELRVPFSCKTRFCPSCGKVRVDNWVNNITKDMLEVSHLHITLTTDDSFRPFFRMDSQLLKELLWVGAQAVQEVLSDLYPGMQIGLVHTVHPFGCDLGYTIWLLPKAALWMANGWRLKASPQIAFP